MERTERTNITIGIYTNFESAELPVLYCEQSSSAKHLSLTRSSMKYDNLLENLENTCDRSKFELALQIKDGIVSTFQNPTPPEPDPNTTQLRVLPLSQPYWFILAVPMGFALAVKFLLCIM